MIKKGNRLFGAGGYVSRGSLSARHLTACIKGLQLKFFLLGIYMKTYIYIYMEMYVSTYLKDIHYRIIYNSKKLEPVGMSNSKGCLLDYEVDL